MKPLHRKLLRTLLWSPGQTIAVMAVVLCGTAAYIATASVYRNLLLTRDTYYAQYRFADFEINLERAPLAVAQKLESIDGVRQVRPRIVRNVNVDLPDQEESRSGRIVSMPERHDPVLNDIVLLRGRYFEENAQEEVIVSDRFATANGLDLGDWIEVAVEDKQYRLRVIATALSPEYVYLIRNVQELIPSAERFGILWVPKDFAETAFSMNEACNNIVGSVDDYEQLDKILDQAEDILEPYGVFATNKSEDQISNRFLSDEIRGLSVSARIIPTIFLGVAAMIIFVLLNRMVRTERTQIGLLKSFGYSNFSVAIHYIQYALILSAGGCLGGFLIGQWLAGLLIGLYVKFYQFPLLESRIYLDVLTRSLGSALLFATLGATASAVRAARIRPAESMRPEAPRFGHRTIIERIGPLWRNLSFTWKMIVRNVSRSGFRAALNAFGVAISVALLIMGFFTIDAMNYMLNHQFKEVQREDVRVSFQTEFGKDVLHDAMRFAHVRRAEPVLQYPFEMRRDWRKKDIAVTGLERGAELQKLLDADGNEIDVGESGLVLSDRLAEEFDVKPGDLLTLEPLMGRVDKIREVRVSQVIPQYLGMSAYMNINALSRLLDQDFAMNAALVRTEEGRERDLNKSLKEVAAIAAVELREDSYQSLINTLAANMKVMNLTLLIFAAVIAMSIIYNVTSVALAERQRELASLRVLGLTESEVGGIVYNENIVLAIVGIFFGIPLGIFISWLLTKAYDTDLYRMPFHIEQRSYIWAVLLTILFVMLANLAVRHKIRALDLVEVLKERD